MGFLGSLIADKVLGPKDEETGRRPGDPGGIADVALGMGTAALAASAAAAMAPDVLANMRNAMDGLVSGGQSVGGPSASANTPASPAVDQALQR